MGRHIPTKYLHEIASGSNRNRKLRVELTHPGFLVLDSEGIQLLEYNNEIAIGVKNVFLMAIPHLDIINKIDDHTVEIRFGHRGGEHATATGSDGEHVDSAAYIRVEFKDYPGTDDIVTPSYSMACGTQRAFPNFVSSFPGYEATYELMCEDINSIPPSGLRFGPDRARYLVVTPQRNESATITIMADPGTGSGQPEINCHVIIAGQRTGVAVQGTGVDDMLNPESCKVESISEINGETFFNYGPGRSTLIVGSRPGYWVAPLIVPHEDADGAVVFEVGDPEPNAKIIIDDA